MVSSHGSNGNLILPGAPRQVRLTLRTRGSDRKGE